MFVSSKTEGFFYSSFSTNGRLSFPGVLQSKIFRTLATKGSFFSKLPRIHGFFRHYNTGEHFGVRGVENKGSHLEL